MPQLRHSNDRFETGPAVDTFGGVGGESKVRLFELYGSAFLAHKSK
jgi:hypothetical protein